LFIERSHVPFVVVKACRSCNATKSKGEADLRDFIVIDKDGGTHPDAARHAEKVARSISKGHANIAKAILRATDEPVFTKNGIYLGDYPSADIDSTNMIETLRFIVRGLYYHERSVIMSSDSPVSVLHIPFWLRQRVYDDFSKLPHPPPRVLGNHVFWWVPYVPEDAPETSAWLMVFFDQVVFVGASGRNLPDQAKAKPDTRVMSKPAEVFGPLSSAGLLQLPERFSLSLPSSRVTDIRLPRPIIGHPSPEGDN
jgi:hypothetical protein